MIWQLLNNLSTSIIALYPSMFPIVALCGIFKLWNFNHYDLNDPDYDRRYAFEANVSFVFLVLRSLMALLYAVLFTCIFVEKLFRVSGNAFY